MEIKNLKISNYKSIEHIELNNVNSFSVFVGANASGKSNIFEAIEFLNQLNKTVLAAEVVRLFGKPEDLFNRKSNNNYKIKLLFNLGEALVPFIELHGELFSEIEVTKIISHLVRNSNEINEQKDVNLITGNKVNDFSTPELKQLYNFTRLFVGNSKIKRQNYIDDLKLNADASNLELVLKRILKNEVIRTNFLEELDVLIPGFENIEIRSDEISGTDTLLIYEKGTKKPFGKNLLSDGTYNIIALLTAVYQSDEPQFLCIEEPENGLNPFVAKEFVRIFRDACNDKGHFIWINTHSQSILSELKQQELIIVDKINGGTIAKQINDIDLQGMKMDEALFTNILGGGTPW